MSQTFFGPGQDYPITNPSQPAFADFNGDGRIDMVALSVIEPPNATPQVSLYFFAGQNSSTSQFAQPTIVAAPSLVAGQTERRPGQLVAGDFDNDQKQDLLAFSDPGFRFLKGNGDGSFQAPGITTFGFSSYVIVRDFNNDGNLDLLFGDASIIRFGNGNGSFRAATTLFSLPCADIVEAQERRTHLADLNRDGLPDAINSCSGTGVAVAYRNSDGSFGSPVVVTSFAGRVVIDDFNSDGINDLLVIKPNQSAIRYGASNGTLLPEASATVQVNLSSSERVWSVVSADLNFDGVKDLLVGAIDSFKVLVGTTPGLFTESLVRQIGAYSVPVSTGYYLEFVDINRDGGPDFYTQSLASDKISIYFSQPPSVFVSTSVNPTQPGVPVTLTALIASPATGVAFTNQGQVTFYSGSNVIGAPVAVVNGTANFTTSSLPQGIHYITAAFQATPNSPVITSKLITVVVTTGGCAASAASFTASGFRFDRNTNQFIQDIDITNRTTVAIPGPVSVMVAGLSSNASLATPYAISTCNSPGTPVVDAGICPNGVLAPNQTVRVTLRFNNPTRTPISYTPQTLAGLGRR